MRDIVVIGSGASAAQAAATLVEAGREVLMIDAGHRDERYADLIPNKPFDEIRRTDPEQHRYFLGDDFEGIPFGPVRVGAQLTPPRQHISRMLARLLPLGAGAFHALESMAVGGLAAGWGAATPMLTDDDMQGWPIDRAALQPSYEAVAARVGISAPQDDDLTPFLGPLGAALPPADIDHNGRVVLDAYGKRRSWFHQQRLYAGLPRLAMATTELRGRGPLAYHDMEFWGDKDRAVYRPVYTVEELNHSPSFKYMPDTIAIGVEAPRQDGSPVRVKVQDLRHGTCETIECNQVVIGAGTIGTTRLVLRSLRLYNKPLPLLSNPYTYYPCLVWRSLGQPAPERRHSLTQVMMYLDPDGTRRSLVQAQGYSYRSLLAFKLVKESPLATRDSIELMRLLMTAFFIVGVHHEDRPTAAKTARLQEGDPPRLDVQYALSSAEHQRIARAEAKLRPLLRKLGCYPLKRIYPGDGSSIHYAGTFPMTTEERPMTTRPDGSLRGMRGVYIVDGSVLPHLPAKGLTFTIMANADRVARGIDSHRG